MIRNAKFWGIEYSDEFNEMLKKTNGLLNDISRHVRNEIVSGEILGINASSLEQYVLTKEEEELTRAKYRDTIRHIFDKYDVLEKRKGLERNLVGYVLERFAGYFKRNSAERPPTITFKNKSLYYKDRNVEIDTDKKQIIFPTVFGDFKVNYKDSIKSENIEGKKFGGNLNIKQKCFIVAVDVPFNQQYDPETVLGFDINKSLDNWIVFNTGEKITPNEIVKKHIDDIRQLNKLIDNKAKSGLKSSQRRGLRKRIINKHKALDNEVSKACKEIIKVTSEKKALLCIDMVKTGQMMGTFGQDKIIPALQTMCENQGVPFIAVPCRNTSRRCSSCGHVAAENRTSTDDFCCVECGHSELSHANAAKNIAFLGEKMFKAGVPCGNHGRISVEKLIEKHGPLQSPIQ